MEKNDKNEFFRTVGERLLAARLKSGLTQREAAGAVGTSQSCISAIENGKKRGSLDIMTELVRLYGTSYDSIFGSLGAAGSAEPSKLGEDPCPIDDGVGISLLSSLAENSGLTGLGRQLSAILKLCEYLLFRQVYGMNPHNSQKLFGLSLEEAEQRFASLLPHEAEQLRQSIRIKPAAAAKLELPVERNAELRAFIKECEALLKTIDDN